MKPLHPTLVALLCPLAASAQNLVVNGTFALPAAGTSNYVNVLVGDTANGVLQQSGTHILNSTGNFMLGDSNSIGGTLNQTGGTVNATGANFRIAHWPNESSLYDISAGQLNVTPDLNIGWDGNGELKVSGTGAVTANTIVVQRDSTLNVDSGNVTGTYLNIGTNRQLGHVDQSGGTIDITGGNGVRLGHWGAGAGSTYTATGGTLNVTSGPLNVGWDGTSTFTTSGTADINVTNNLLVQRASSLNAGGGDITAGSITIGSGGRGNGIVNVSGTQTINTGTIQVQTNSDLNVAGGTVNGTFLDVGRGPGPGNITQTNVDITINGEVRIGHWAAGAGSQYDMSGGTLTVLGAGTGPESAGIITIGVDGTGVFNHSDGTITTQGIYLDSRGATNSGANANQYTMTGGTLVLTGVNGIDGQADNTTYDINLGGGTIVANTNTNIWEPTNATGTNGDVTFDTNGNTISVRNTMSGPGGFIKEGAGTLDMRTAGHTFTSAVVNDGTLNLGGGSWATSFFAPGAPQATIQVNNGGTLLTGSGPNGGAHDLGGLGGAFNQPVVEVNEGGTWQLDREQYLSANNLDLNGGTVNIVNNDLRLQAGTVTVGASPTGSDIVGNLTTLYGDVTFDVADDPAAPHDLSIAAPINESGSRSITKTGAGTLSIEASANHTGQTIISDGDLLLPTGGAITMTSNMIINSAGAVTLDGGTVNTGDTTWDGSIVDHTICGVSNYTEGDGMLTSTPTSNLELTMAGNVFDLTGALDLSAGGTLTGFDLFSASYSPFASPYAGGGANTFEVLLAKTTGGITGNFAAWDFGNGTSVGTASDVLYGFDFTVEARGGELFLVANVPEPSRSALLLVGFLLPILRRRR